MITTPDQFSFTMPTIHFLNGIDMPVVFGKPLSKTLGIIPWTLRIT